MIVSRYIATRTDHELGEIAYDHMLGRRLRAEAQEELRRRSARLAAREGVAA